LRSLAGLTVAVVVLLSGGPLTARAADPRLEAAQDRRQAVQERLDELYQRLTALEVEAEAVQARLDELTATQQQSQAQADAASGAVASQVRESYMLGTTDPTLSMFSSASPQQAAEQLRLLELLARGNQAEYETAGSAQVRSQAAAVEVEETAAELRERQAEVEAARVEVAALVAEATEHEEAVRDTIAAEEEAHRLEQERLARQAAERDRRAREEAARPRAAAPAAAAIRPTSPRGGGSSSGTTATAGAAAPVAGNIACPVGSPRSYSDTWGAPRSGGRSHKGTDILAPHGTPIYAYESGVVTRMNGSSVGGISLYLRGNSGAGYYYTHLSGYVSGISAGSSVSAGQHIARNGDTGNARGTPHLHFEVMPGGGGNVNPYPYVTRACG